MDTLRIAVIVNPPFGGMVTPMYISVKDIG
jgi:hypothetical protein